ncbi:DUF2817 domain-containing protein, partial [Mesorhizobium sp. M7D.F.Ca.US.004.03.1.1]|uniref:DUF2817 domain-containing protein n=1 Tax=Mesorhizobium sp. M7D.F.Ca.US.004.03.1.1 TaxID=2496702 RepID=UPI000FC9F5D8
VMVLVSSTHGVEGFCGTGAQLDWMSNGGPPTLPEDTAALIVHAINPYGYSWQRRGTEGNVDLNRNGLDFTDGPLDNPRFLELADAFSPSELNGPVADAALAKRERFIEEHGLAEYRRVRTMGQHVDPQGIHYGGEGPTWSRMTIERMVQDFSLSTKTQVAIIDYHTGLGPFGYGEPICGCRPEEPGRDRATAWYGDSLTEPLRGTSTSAVIPGLTQYIWAREIGIERVTFIALEYGTYPSGDVENAMRDECWLYRYGDPGGLDDVARGIK